MLLSSSITATSSHEQIRRTRSISHIQLTSLVLFGPPRLSLETQRVGIQYRLGAIGLDPTLSEYSDSPSSRCTARRDSAPRPEPEQYHVSDRREEEQSGGRQGESLRSAGRLRSYVVDKRSGEGLHEDVTAENWSPSVHKAWNQTTGTHTGMIWSLSSTSC